MLVYPDYLSVLLNLIIQKYHFEALSICILWNDNFPLTLAIQSNDPNYIPITSIYKAKYFNPDDDIQSPRLIDLTEFGRALAAAIEEQFCETFIAFEDEIADFASTFLKSVIHSKWRTTRNKFLFIYRQDRFNLTSTSVSTFFKDQSSILFIEVVNDTIFNLKTNKYTGSRKDHPEELVLLDIYNGATKTFQFNKNVYPDKTRDMKGREMIVGAFPYEPFSVLKNSTETNAMDVGNGNEDPSKRLFFDGIDGMFYFNFCRLYNCTIQVDAGARVEWGNIYPNFTGDGVVGRILERKVDTSMLALFIWYDPYLRLDMSSYTFRDGITCLVPKAKRKTSWLLALQPFHWLLWVGIATCIFIETIGLLVTRKIERENSSWLNCFYFGVNTTLKLFISQSTNDVVMASSIRMVLIACYIIDIIITSVYSGGLSSILTIPVFEEAADSADRLAKQKLEWAGTSYDWILLFEPEDETTVQIFADFRMYSAEELQEKSLTTSNLGIVVERLEFGHFAIPGYIKKGAVNRLKIMIDDIFYQYCATYAARPWPLLEKYNNFVRMVQSSGLNKFWEWRMVSKHLDENMQKQVMASMSNSFEDVGAVKLGMANFAGIIVIWIIGVVLAVFVFIGEIIVARRNRK